jgi:hypothetical protein
MTEASWRASRTASAIKCRQKVTSRAQPWPSVPIDVRSMAGKSYLTDDMDSCPWFGSVDLEMGDPTSAPADSMIAVLHRRLSRAIPCGGRASPGRLGQVAARTGTVSGWRILARRRISRRPGGGSPRRGGFPVAGWGDFGWWVVFVVCGERFRRLGEVLSFDGAKTPSKRGKTLHQATRLHRRAENASRYCDK